MGTNFLMVKKEGWSQDLDSSPSFTRCVDRLGKSLKFSVSMSFFAKG